MTLKYWLRFLDRILGLSFYISLVHPQSQVMFLGESFLRLLDKQTNSNSEKYDSAVFSDDIDSVYKETAEDELDELDSFMQDLVTDCHCSDSCNCLKQISDKIDELEDEMMEKYTRDNNGCTARSASSDDPYEFKEGDDSNFFGERSFSPKVLKTHKKSKGTKKLKNELSARTKTKLDPSILAWEMQQRCCKKFCLKKVPLVTGVCIRDQFWKMSHFEQQQHVKIVLQQTPVVNGRRFFSISVNDAIEGVCRQAWCTLHGISLTRYDDLLAKFKSQEHENISSLPRSRSLGYDLAKEWFRKFIFMADTEPTSGVKHLPSCLTKTAVYLLYQEQMKMKGTTDVLSRSHFVYWLWKKEFSYVSIPKQSRFAKCNVCEYLKENLRSPRMDNEERERLVLMRKIHLTQQMAEREKYYLHGLKARLNPDKYLSIMLDGMDQCKTQLPHFCVNTKAEAQCQRLKTHITGVLINARAQAHCFIDTCEYSHDSSFTISLLHKLLIKITKEKGFLPPVLYVQMDNCARENKNKYVLAYLSLLVHMKVFEKIRLGFLMVGHTHEDIDQMFSCVSRHMNKNNVPTIKGLSAAIQSAYSPTPSVSYVKDVFNIKKWLEDSDALEKTMAGHSTQHQFKIEKNETGCVHIMYKKWSTKKTWLSVRSKGSKNGRLLQALKKVPPGNPPTKTPDSKKMKLEEFCQDLPKYSLRFKDEDAKEWKDFLKDFESRVESLHPNEPWSFQPLLPSNQRRPQPPTPTEQEKKVTKELDRLMLKQTEEILITVQSPKKKKDKAKKRKRGGRQEPQPKNGKKRKT